MPENSRSPSQKKKKKKKTSPAFCLPFLNGWHSLKSLLACIGITFSSQEMAKFVILTQKTASMCEPQAPWSGKVEKNSVEKPEIPL